MAYTGDFPAITGDLEGETARCSHPLLASSPSDRRFHFHRAKFITRSLTIEDHEDPNPPRTSLRLCYSLVCD